MAPLRFTVFAFLTLIGLASAVTFDVFYARRRSDSSDKFDGAEPGKCSLSGCTRGPDRVCRGPLSTLFPVREVNDRKGKSFKRGARNCAKLCRAEGKLEDGTNACESFNYIPVERNSQEKSDCILYKGFPNNVLGNRAGSTRVDFTGYYCYTRQPLILFPRSPPSFNFTDVEN